MSSYQNRTIVLSAAEGEVWCDADQVAGRITLKRIRLKGMRSPDLDREKNGR
jgi:hypothetical protein